MLCRDTQCSKAEIGIHVCPSIKSNASPAACYYNRFGHARGVANLVNGCDTNSPLKVFKETGTPGSLVCTLYVPR